MRELLEFILESIVGNGFSIEEKKEDEKTIFNITADSVIIGILIGKGGRTIQAIQDVVRVRGKLEKKFVFVNIKEAQQ